MSYAFIGFGKIDRPLAHDLARSNIDVTFASRRPPEELASIAWVYLVAANTNGHLVAVQKR
jgi:predicted dinucleotide-binding enzyme